MYIESVQCTPSNESIAEIARPGFEEVDSFWVNAVYIVSAVFPGNGGEEGMAICAHSHVDADGERPPRRR